MPQSPLGELTWGMLIPHEAGRPAVLGGFGPRPEVIAIRKFQSSFVYNLVYHVYKYNVITKLWGKTRVWSTSAPRTDAIDDLPAV